MGVKQLLTLKEVCFENMLLRRMFGAKKYKVTREWRILHNEELKEEECLHVQEWGTQ
jgi:hypothetical protein